MKLDIDFIKASLKNLSIQNELYYFKTITSTNTFLKEKSTSHPTLEICLADEQTQGRGQGNNTWYSPPGSNIYCSTKWLLPITPNALSGLSLVISLAILNTIQRFYCTTDLRLKWPNDVLWQHKKLAGTLIEIIPEPNGLLSVIIGIGFNVNLEKKDHTIFSSSWCSLFEITGKTWNRSELVIELIKQLQKVLESFLKYGFSYFKSIWNDYDYLKNKRIMLTTLKETFYGIGHGVNDRGYLLLKDEHGKETAYNQGTVRLRHPERSEGSPFE